MSLTARRLANIALKPFVSSSNVIMPRTVSCNRERDRLIATVEPQRDGLSGQMPRLAGATCRRRSRSCCRRRRRGTAARCPASFRLRSGCMNPPTARPLRVLCSLIFPCTCRSRHCCHSSQSRAYGACQLCTRPVHAAQVSQGRGSWPRDLGSVQMMIRSNTQRLLQTRESTSRYHLTPR